VPVTKEEIEGCLSRIESSPGFSRSERLVRFLRYIAGETLDGRSDRLKEYTIAIEVFGRPETYDPQVDSLVRVQASLLRDRLAKYYENEGRDEPIRIEVPKGRYEPVFQRVNGQHAVPGAVSAPEAPAPPVAAGSTRRPFGLVAIAGAAAVFLIAAGLLWRGRTPAAIGSPSVAVLPFVDLSAAKDGAFLGDGIAEELIYALGRVHGFRVVARTSAFQYRGKAEDVRRIGQELNVRSVVEGTVRREGNALHVTADLIDTSNGYRVWGAEYDRQMGDLLAVEQEIAHAIAASLSTQRIDAGAPAPAPTPQAYERYMTGIYWRAIPTVDRLYKALGEFQAAAAADPAWAPAQAGVAETYGRLYYAETLSTPDSVVTAKSVTAAARTAADRALQLDGSLARAHEAAALVALIDWDMARADSEYRRALELDPSDVRTRFAYAQLCLNPSRRYREAIQELQKGLELDPVSTNMITELGAAYRMSGQFALAREQFRKSLALDPNAAGTRTNLAFTDVEEGRYGDAVARLEKVNAEWPGDPWIMGHLGYAYAKAGRAADARRVLEETARSSTAAMHIAAIYAGLGENERALDWLEKGVALHSPSMFWLKTDFRFDGLRGTPRYAALARRMPW
jgi:serine/threonine-protein kinase